MARRRFPALRITYVALMAVFYGSLAVSWLGDDRTWFVAMATNGTAGIVLLPTVVLAVALAVKRRWPDLGACLALGMGYLVVSGQLQWRPTHVQARGSDAIKVMTFNVEHGWQGIDRVASLVRVQAPDAVAFQELGLPADARAVDRLKQLLPDYRFFSDGSRTSATRLPVVAERSIPLKGPGSWTMVEQVVRVGGRTVRVLNVHSPSYLPEATQKRPVKDWLKRFGEVSREQHDLIESELALIAGDETPSVLCGDFNMAPVGDRYRRLAARAKDAFAEVGNGTGWTSPAVLPLRRIDYVWCFNGCDPLEAWTTTALASDHQATVARVALPADASP